MHSLTLCYQRWFVEPSSVLTQNAIPALLFVLALYTPLLVLQYDLHIHVWEESGLCLRNKGVPPANEPVRLARKQKLNYFG